MTVSLGIILMLPERVLLLLKRSRENILFNLIIFTMSGYLSSQRRAMHVTLENWKTAAQIARCGLDIML